MQTVWVLGDQLNRSIGALAGADPSTHRVLLVESAAKLASKRWHRQRAHFVVTSMRRFAGELCEVGFEVDHRRSESLRSGYRAHVDEFAPDAVLATEPASIDGLAMLRRSMSRPFGRTSSCATTASSHAGSAIGRRSRWRTSIGGNGAASAT